MSLQELMRTVVYRMVGRVWGKLPRRSRKNHELRHLVHYHPFMFGRVGR